MTPFALSGLLTGLSSVSFGLFVLLMSSNRKIGIRWFTFTLSVAIWGFSVYWIGMAQNPIDGLVRWKLAYGLGVIWIAVLFYHFVCTFLDLKRTRSILLHYMIGLACVACLPTDLLFKRVDWVFDSMYYAIGGRLYPLFFLWWGGLVIYSHVELILGYSNVTVEKKNQIKFFFLSTAVGYAGGSTSYFPNFGLNVYPWGNFGIVLYPIIMSYAILYHQLLNLRLVLRDTALHLTTAWLLLCGCLVIGLPLAHVNPYVAVIGSTILMAALMAFAYEPMHRALQPAIDRVIFANRFAYLEELSQLPNDLHEFTNLREMLTFLLTRLKDAARLERVRILMYDPSHQSYIENVFETDLPADQRVSAEISDSSALVQLLKTEDRLWTCDELAENDADHPALLEIKGLGGAACFPVNKEKELLGFVLLGPKHSGEAFNQKDLKIMRALRMRLENFLAQAMSITQEALNMVKDSHDMKNDVNAMKGRVTWRAMRSGGWKTEFDTDLNVADTIAATWPANDAESGDRLRKALASVREKTLSWYGDLQKSVPIEEGTLKRLAHRLRNWAEYGRLVSEGFRGQRQQEAIDVADSAKFSVERWRPMAERKELALTAEVAESLWVWGERSLVEQIIENLIDNAIKATATGSIGVQARTSGGEIQIEVKDTGYGIPEEHLATIFERPFYQGKGRENLEQSTGVGLYLVAQYAKSLGGRVSADSREGVGSTFRVVLPAYRKPSAGAVA